MTQPVLTSEDWRLIQKHISDKLVAKNLPPSSYYIDAREETRLREIIKDIQDHIDFMED